MFNFTKLNAVVAIMMFTIGTVSAQDIIVLNNSSADEIEAKVQEVSLTEVKYKKWSYQDGPTFTIPTSDIFVIKYRNSEKQRFGVEKTDTHQSQEAYVPYAAKQNTQRDTNYTGTLQSQSNVSQAPTNTAYQSTSQNNQSTVVTPKIENENLERGCDGSSNVAFILGLDDWWAVSVTATLGYRFNPYVFVGGTTGAIYNEYATLIPIMSTFRSDVPLGRRSSFFGEVSLGGGIAVDGGDSGFLASVGPGFAFGGFSIGVNYLYMGEGAGGIAFKLGFEF